MLSAGVHEGIQVGEDPGRHLDAEVLTPKQRAVLSAHMIDPGLAIVSHHLTLIGALDRLEERVDREKVAATVAASRESLE